MSKQQEAMRLALEALEATSCYDIPSTSRVRTAIATLRAALAEPNRAQKMRDALYTRRPTIREMSEPTTEDSSAVEPVQEPVAQAVGRTLHWHEGKGVNDAQLYLAAPPQRKPLSDADLAKIWDDALDQLDPRDQLRFIARAIEAAHGIKEGT